MTPRDICEGLKSFSEFGFVTLAKVLEHFLLRVMDRVEPLRVTMRATIMASIVGSNAATGVCAASATWRRARSKPLAGTRKEPRSPDPLLNACSSEGGI